MTTETTLKPQLCLFNVHCKSAAGTVGDWTVVAATAEAAIMQVTRRLLMYFGAGIIQKQNVPAPQEIKASMVLEPLTEALKTYGVHTEKLTVPAQTFSTTF